MARTPPSTETMRLMEMAAQYIRQPSGAYDEDGVGFVEFDPPLTTQEQASLETLRALVRSHTALTPAEYLALRDEFSGLAAYHALATPNLAQTATALKALIRVVRALVRET